MFGWLVLFCLFVCLGLLLFYFQVVGEKGSEVVLFFVVVSLCLVYVSVSVFERAYMRGRVCVIYVFCFLFFCFGLVCFSFESLF